MAVAEPSPVAQRPASGSPAAVAAAAPVSQARVFRRLRWRLARNAGRLLLQTARVRVVSIVVCSLMVGAIVFAGSYAGFAFLSQQKIPFSGQIVGTLFDFL